MFEIGDKVVCINDTIHNKRKSNFIKLDKIYTIDKYRIKESVVELTEFPKCYYSDKKFISLLEHRKRKIKKICSKETIK
jgi:hypothetical protein